MSALATSVTQAPSAAPADAAPRALGDLHRGERAVICGLSDACDASVRRRLNQLGFVEGREVEVVRRAPLGSPVVVRVCDAQICLRKAQTKLISVAEHGGASSASPVNTAR